MPIVTKKTTTLLSILMIVFYAVPMGTTAGERPASNEVLSVVQKMASEFQKVEDYTCEVEQIYYRDGKEDQRYRFKFYFKKAKNIRVEFLDPYAGVTVLYRQEIKKATVIPFPFLPTLTFHFSTENPMAKTPTGQRLDQTDMSYFIEFALQNLDKVPQIDDEFQNCEEQITFMLRAFDYVRRDTIEKYRVIISKKYWLPILIERYDLDGKPIEASHIKNYTINTDLDEGLFRP